MTRRIILLLVLFGAAAMIPTQSQAIKPIPNSIARAPHRDEAESVFANTASAVVFLITRKSGQSYALASGILLSPDGYIGTNFHALQGADTVEVRFFPNAAISEDYRSFNVVKLLYADSKSDIAILKINTSLSPFLRCSASTEVRVGEKVYAIGNPKGLTNTISEGIVSAFRLDQGEEVIQHTAAISHGSSGGALVDSTGALIGMNSWQLAEGQNLNFAISATHVLKALAAARKNVNPLPFPAEEVPSNQAIASDSRRAEAGEDLAFPLNWIDPKESPDHIQEIRVHVIDPYVYAQWTITATAPGIIVRREQTCDTKKTNKEWEGQCVAVFTLGYDDQPRCLGIKQRITITLLTPARIEGLIQHLDFPKDFPNSCPVVQTGQWGHFVMIPKP